MTSTPRAAGRRPVLPGADELFRTTGDPARAGSSAAADQTTTGHRDTGSGGGRAAGAVRPLRRGPSASTGSESAARGAESRARAGTADRAPSGRERHDEKITVYVSAAELVDLERARLVLRADHGLGVDRGRLVREALSYVLADLEANGSASILVQRLGTDGPAA